MRITIPKTNTNGKFYIDKKLQHTVKTDSDCMCACKSLLNTQNLIHVNRSMRMRF